MRERCPEDARYWAWAIALVGVLALAAGAALAAAGAGGPQATAPAPFDYGLRPSAQGAPPVPVPGGHIATDAELQTAQAQWAVSRHASTYDNGLGANTTCASCKSPRNWDPNNTAVEASHDCASCKREPGMPRPDLPGGVAVPKGDWKSITCDVCHQPVGDSYNTAIAYWNQATGAYEPIGSSTELCGKCHEGLHGFEAIFEQASSQAHKGWDCTRCHGSHGQSVKCTDCHDATTGKGAPTHANHPRVDCTACHDAGGLGIWQDPYPESRRYGLYYPVRFGHALRSWPSHNLQTAVDCRRCHHPQGDPMPKLPSSGQAEAPIPVVQPALASRVGCAEPGCHADGASFEWCPAFPRDPAPEVTRP